MASVPEQMIVMPTIDSFALRSPRTAATPAPAARMNSLFDPDGYEPLADVARVMSRAMDADGMLVAWHDHDAPPMTLFADGACETTTPANTAWLPCARGTAAHTEWCLLDDGVQDGGLLTTSIPTGGGVVTISSLFHRIGEGTRSKAREATNRLLPLLQPFFSLWGARLRMQSRMRGLTEAVNKSDVGILLVDGHGRPLFVNAAAQALIECNDGLKNNGALLSGNRLSDTLRLQAAIEHVVGGAGDGGKTVAPVVALNRRDQRPLLAAIVASDVRPASSEECAAVIHVFDPAQDLRPLVEPACKLYGLSPVETRLACLMADGISLTDAAERMHIREQTARSYLKQIFQKTETKRQAELVWLLLKSSVRTVPGCRTSLI